MLADARWHGTPSRIRGALPRLQELRLEAETQVGQTLTSLLSVAEQYRELHSSGHFRDLRLELADAG